jgi:hypothetical protein
VDGKESFYSDNLVDMDNVEISIERNSSIKEQVAELSQQVTLVFVTPSAYCLVAP